MPRLDTDFAAAWRGEGTAFNETVGEFGAVTLRPKSLACITKISIELVEDSGVDLGSWVQQQLDAVLRAGLEDAILRGTGAARHASRLGELPRCSHAVIGRCHRGLRVATHRDGRHLGFERHTERRDLRLHGGEGHRELEHGISGDKSPLRQPPALDYLGHYVSNHATSGSLYLADWTTVVVGFKPSSLRFQVLRERFADQGMVGVAADLRADVCVLHPEHVSITPGIS